MPNRSKRKLIAEETLRILEAGEYLAPNGESISIRASQNAAESGTRLYQPHDLDDLSDTETGTGSPAELPQIEVFNETTFAGARQLLRDGAGRVCALNFASAKNPGGGFLGGAEAQEECLARASGLFPCLLAARPYYEANRRCGTVLYTHHLIYSPGVPVFRDDHDELLEDWWEASIITAPAPNRGALKNPQSIELVLPTLTERAIRVVEIARVQGERHLVLGAWGCGVFRNRPEQVAEIFRAVLALPRFAGAFERVRFSILDQKDRGTFRAFRDAFS